jgi:signal transduction histidine kinase
LIDDRQDTDTSSLLERLRRLAAEDPRSARNALSSLFTSQPDRARVLMGQLGTAKDGRLRNLVARVVPELRSTEAVLPFLMDWRTRETDEFTRRAIALALDQLKATPMPPLPVTGSLSVYPDQIAESYQFVSSRLKHKLANGIMQAHSHLMRLKLAVQTRDGDGVENAMADLREQFSRLGVAVEAADVAPEQFEIRRIALVDWLKTMNGRYASQFSRIDLQIEGDLDPPMIIDASDYLLETVFWNTWVNAHEAAGTTCRLVVRAKKNAGSIELFVIDNGPGFPEPVRYSAFRERYSTNGANRGRGLLEIDDAMRRLQGTVRLAPDGVGTFRLLFEFPEPPRL